MDVNVIDLHFDGHHRSYLEMLAGFWSLFSTDGVLRIFVTEDFVRHHPDFESSLGGRVELHAIDVGVMPSGTGSLGGLVRLSRSHSKALASVASSFEGPTLLMYFDHAQIAVATFRGRRDSVSGIYFRSPFHERDTGRLSRPPRSSKAGDLEDGAAEQGTPPTLLPRPS